MQGVATNPEAAPRIFATTRWSLVLAAGRDHSSPAREAARTALNCLCRTYWPAVHAFIRARVRGAGEAEDLTQEFFFQLLEGQYLAQVDPRNRPRSACAAGGNEAQFDALKIFLTGVKPDATYAEFATRLGTTEAALKMRVKRLRHRYGELIREEILRTLADPAEVEDEMRHLLRVVSE